MITVDDFVMLGTTVPEPAKQTARTMVCSAGYSPTLRQLIRIYPLARRNIPHRWHTYKIDLERNPRDSRKESYQIVGDRSQGAHEKINDKFVLQPKRATAEGLAPALKKFVVGSIDEANDKRLSLAILQPDHMRLEFDFNPESPDSPQLALFDTDQGPSSGSKRFPYNPRLCFRDGAVNRRMQLRDWGCYEYMRKWGPDRRRDIWNNLHVGPTTALLVGNMQNQLTQWLVISVLNGLREQATLFDELVDVNGSAVLL